MEPGYRPAMGVLACALEHIGKKDSSVVCASKSATRSATDYEGVPGYFKIEPQPYGQYWEEVLNRSLEDRKTQKIPNMVMAVLYMRNNDRENAIKSLQKAYEIREGSIVYINAEPLFRPLHADSRYQAIIAGMGLSD